MTAHPGRRRRRTIFGAVIAGALTISAAALTVVGTLAVANSTEGEAVAVDERLVSALPATDNGALAIVDDDNRLTSVVVVTLRPAGGGGSIVTIPVDTDASNGFGDERLPLASLLDPDDPDAFFGQLEDTLAITLQFGEIVGPDRLAELLAPVLPFAATFPSDVTDSDSAGDGLIVEAGIVELDEGLVSEVLQSVDLEAGERLRHSIDVAVWSGAADAAGDGVGTEVALDDAGRPATSASLDEVFGRLWNGPVQARDLALLSPRPPGAGSSVVLDRADVVLVFAQVSPARVSTPLPGPVFRVVVPLRDEQIEESDSGFGTRRDVARKLVEELLFYEVNVVSVDATAGLDPAPEVTLVEVADPDFVDVVAIFWPAVLGEIDVVLADSLIDGVDVVVHLGTGYLDVERPGLDASTATDAATVDADG